MLQVLITIIVSWLVFVEVVLLLVAYREYKRFKNKEVKYLIKRDRFGVSVLIGVDKVTYSDNGVVSYIAPNGLKITTHLSNVIIYSHEK